MSHNRPITAAWLIAIFAFLALALAACQPSSQDNDNDGTREGQQSSGGDDGSQTSGTVTDALETEESFALTGSRSSREMPPPAPGSMAYSSSPEPNLSAPGYNPDYRPVPVEDREQYEDTPPNRFYVTWEDPVSTFSADVDSASYSNMRRMLEAGQLPTRGAVRTEELVNYFDYDYAPAQSADEPFRPTVWVTPTPWNEGTQLLHVGIRGFDDLNAEPPLLNLVFLIDVSGSMNSHDKLPLVQQSLRLLVNEMRDDDRISIVTYAGHAGVLLEPTEARNRVQILQAIDSLSAGGSTAGADGMRLAYGLAEQNYDEARVNRIIMASDGDFNVGTTDNTRLEDFIAEQRETGIYFTYLGYGTGNYNDQRAQVLAQAGNGIAAYIDGLTEARRVLVEQMRATLFPIADDVKFQIEFNPATVAEYRLVGYETRLLAREDFNNDEVDAGDIGAGHTVTAIYEIVPVGSDAAHYDELRYQDRPEVTAGNAAEYGFLRMRYKLPGEDESTLIEQPILVAEAFESIGDAPADARFAAAVAAMGQHLRGDPYLGDYSLDDVRTLALSGRGEDEGGYRSEFIQLVGLAQSLEGRTN